MRASAKVVRESIGASICLAATALAVFIWHGRPHPPSILPLVFLILVIWMAVQFGRHVGFIGTLLATGTLALFVYAPVGNLQIKDSTAAGYMIALLFGGIIGTELLADPSETAK